MDALLTFIKEHKEGHAKQDAENELIAKVVKNATVEVPDANTINVSGIDKQRVGQFAAVVRATKKPEPYGGKGIRYKDEHVRRKEGKTAAAKK